MEPIGQLLNLETLYARGLGLTFLDWMENLNQITVLGLSDNAISDISLLANHPQVGRLELENNQISDISALAGHDGLASLWLSGNQIADISPLATATVYSSLRLDENDIEDISALAEMGKTIDSGALCEVFLHGNRIVDLSPLAGMDELSPWPYGDASDAPGLTLWDNRIQDLSPLAGLPIAQSLAEWDFSRNEISDLGPLASFGDIGFLDISENKVSDLSPLAGKDLGELVARKNEIHDLTPLLGLHKPSRLDLTDNRVVSAVPLVALARMLPDDDAVEFLLGNPLGELATGFDIPRLCETLQHAIYYDDGETCSWNTENIELPPYDPDPPPYTGPEKTNPEGCDGAPAWLATGSLPGDSHAGAEFAVDDSVVEDLLTGLQWRRCSVGQTPGVDACAGSSAAMTFAEAASACEGSYGGHSDWRLPSLSELASLVNCSVSYPGPTIDAAAFPGTYTGGYWASNSLPSTGGQAGWFVNFYNGSSMIAARWDEDFVRRVRCVRGGGPGAPWEERFAPGAVDGTTIADTWTGLEWRRCAEGQVWNGSTCAGIGDPVSGADAASACAEEFVGHADWRLPTIAELSSIANRCGADPASYTGAFPGLPGVPFWSSTAFPDTVEKTWTVDFGYGWIAFVKPEDSAWVRCVREQ
jgi:internalin A